jgi:subtilisin family serine protease
VFATDSKGMYLVNLSNSDKTAVLPLIKQWKNNKDAILYSGFVFVDKQGKEIAAITNRIIVRLKKEDDYPILQESIMLYVINKVEQNEFDNLTYLLSLDYSSEKDALQIANELYEKGIFEFAEPDLLLFIKYETDDTYFPQQWGLSNTGQYGGTSGMDIHATQAWNITTGSLDVKIAILDSGVDLTHPDLVSNLLSGYDATGGAIMAINRESGMALLVRE